MKFTNIAISSDGSRYAAIDAHGQAWCGDGKAWSQLPPHPERKEGWSPAADPTLAPATPKEVPAVSGTSTVRGGPGGGEDQTTWSSASSGTKDIPVDKHEGAAWRDVKSGDEGGSHKKHK